MGIGIGQEQGEVDRNVPQKREADAVEQAKCGPVNDMKALEFEKGGTPNKMHVYISVCTCVLCVRACARVYIYIYNIHNNRYIYTYMS